MPETPKCRRRSRAKERQAVERERGSFKISRLSQRAVVRFRLLFLLQFILLKSLEGGGAARWELICKTELSRVEKWRGGLGIAYL
jgi:hypothetical protein